MQAARRLQRRSARDRDGRFLIEGHRSIVEALESGYPVTEVFMTEDAVERAEIERRALEASVALHRVGRKVLRALSDTSTPQGSVAVAKLRTVPIEQLAETGDLVLVLAEVRDPGNAGTLIRSTVAAGASGIVFGSRSVDPFGPKTVRASAGAIFKTRIVRDAPIEDAVEAFRRVGTKLIGSAAGASRSVAEADLAGAVAVVLGNESWGLSDETASLLDEVVGIPMPGPAESLNVGIAGSILLFECVRRRSGA